MRISPLLVYVGEKKKKATEQEKRKKKHYQLKR